MTIVVTRLTLEEPAPCPVHGAVIDVLTLTEGNDTKGATYHCSRCLAAASGFRSWFYTGSPHGHDIARLIA